MAGRVDGVRVTFDEGEVLALFDCDAARADVVGRRDERALLEAAGDRKYVGGHGRRSPLDKCMSASKVFVAEIGRVVYIGHEAFVAAQVCVLFAVSLEVLHLTAVVERCATFCAPIIGGRAGRARDSQRASANLIENNCRSLA